MMRSYWLTTLVVSMLLAAQASAGQQTAGAFQRVRETGSPWRLADGGRPVADVTLVGSASQSELVRNAAEWIAAFVEQSTKTEIPLVQADSPAAGKPHLVVVVGDAKQAKVPGFEGTDVGPEGFAIRRVSAPNQGDLLVCWAPTAIGCRYGLIEILRSLHVHGTTIETDLARVVDRPQFSMRIFYLNFAEHLQNAFNPNVLFDVPVNRWSDADWERLIDMISAFRYNIFEFWLVPTLFSPEALQGGKIQQEFAQTINRVIAYGKRRGVAVHPIQAINTVGADWHYHCPNDPKERAEMFALWDHWSKAIQGNDYIGFFPGDPGGCTRNGCTAETYVDVCLELAKIVRKNNPTVTIEVGTWGDPMAGWGVPLWTGKPDRAKRAMQYFLAKLPEFPEGTFTSINLGFSPDAGPGSHGGDGRPYAKEAAKTNRVLTWDYSVSEGEGTVAPHCRLRRMLQRRREEQALGCYSGGICYTMAPKLQCLTAFCAAEAWWNPDRVPEEVLADYGRLVFGDELAGIGPLLEEFEVVPDWGYYPPFPYSPERLRDSMAKLRTLLDRVSPQATSHLPLAPTMTEYRDSLLFFAQLFERLGSIGLNVETMTAVAKQSGRLPQAEQRIVSIDEVEAALDTAEDFPQKARLRELAGQLRQVDVEATTKQYWSRVYGIYDVIPHPTDPRAQGATAVLFTRFHCEAAMPHKPTPLKQALQSKGKPFMLIDLGLAAGERGWTLSGWTLNGEEEGVAWRASFDQPGLIARQDFQNQGYRWLVVRLTEGPKGGSKKIAINGQVVGEFVRTGPPLSERKEWWVVRSYPIPEGLLKSGPLEIRFTEPGIAIDSVALSAERIEDTP